MSELSGVSTSTENWVSSTVKIGTRYRKRTKSISGGQKGEGGRFVPIPARKRIRAILLHIICNSII